MADYIITETEISDSQDITQETIHPITKEDADFIDDNVTDNEIDFYHSNTERTALELDYVPVIKKNVAKLRIEPESGSDSEEYYDEEEKQHVVPNSEKIEFPEDNKIILSERMRMVSGTDNYEEPLQVTHQRNI